MRILVVEDEKDINNFIKKTLEAELYAVDTAENGAEGFEKAQDNKYDLLLLDNIMPELTGREMCEKLRGQGNNIPIMMLSANSEVTAKVDLLNAGVDDYLTKPFSVDELLARIKALLRRPLKIEKERYFIDNLIVDVPGHSVRRGDKEISLTKKQFALLLYLFKNQGLVLSRSMIMEHVWDMGADPFSNTIESHMAALRKKIDLPGSRKLFHTISGRGYKFGLGGHLK